MDIEPGMQVEFYRGTPEHPFTLGSVYTCTEVYATDPVEWGPCRDCLPGWDAPAIRLAEVDWPQDKHLCSCCFRPVRKPPPVVREVDARQTEDA